MPYSYALTLFYISLIATLQIHQCPIFQLLQGSRLNALFRINGKHKHKGTECILLIKDINDISVSPVKQLLLNSGNILSFWVKHFVIPPKEITLN